MVEVPTSSIVFRVGSYDPVQVLSEEAKEYRYLLAPREESSKLYGSYYRAFNKMKMDLSEDSYSFGYNGYNKDRLQFILDLELDDKRIRFEHISYFFSYLSEKSENTIIDLMERCQSIHVEDIEKEDRDEIIITNMREVLLENVFSISKSGRCNKLSMSEVEAMALGSDVIRHSAPEYVKLNIERIADDVYKMIDNKMLRVSNYRSDSMVAQIAIGIKTKLMYEDKITERQTREIINDWIKWQYY
jgi:hypothetical protein